MKDNPENGPDGTHLRVVSDQTDQDLQDDLKIPTGGSAAPKLFLSAIAATALVFVAYGIAKACGADLHGREMAALAAAGALLVGTGVRAFLPRFSMTSLLWAMSSACAFTGVCWVVFMATSRGLFLAAGFVMMLAAILAALFRDADQAVGFNAMLASLLAQICAITLFLKP